MYDSETLFWYKAVVHRKYDGDTWYLDIDLGFGTWLHEQSIRLYGIDTPELRGEERPEGLEVLDIVNEWCPDGTVVYLQSYKGRKGKYGRWLGMIWPEGWDTSVNQRLLDEGHATEYMK